MNHTLPEVQEIIDYDFLRQKLDDSIKLDILYYELDRLEKTLELRGSPYVFLDPREIEISVQAGRKRFERHKDWIAKAISEKRDKLPEQEDEDQLSELYNSLIDVLWREDLHAMVILTLAQIVIVEGLDAYCRADN